MGSGHAVGGISGPTDGTAPLKQGEIPMRLANEANIRSWPSLRPVADAGSVAAKQENAQLRVITNELSHRIKNLVVIIQSIRVPNHASNHHQGGF